MADHLLEVRDLSVTFHTVRGPVKAVRNVSWHLDRGEVLAILKVRLRASRSRPRR